MHCNYITLRALTVQLLVLMQTSLHVVAEESTSTITTTSTTVVSTQWVVVTSAAGSIVTYTTSAFVTGSTLGVTNIAGSTRFAEPTSDPSVPVSADMAWEGKGFRDAVLNSTNLYRTQHEAEPVKWDDSLASYAQDHADTCKFAHTGGSYGENLAQGYTSPILAIDGWANEESDYDYEKREFTTEAGHFTQLVWKNTTAVGCGAADCDDGGWLLVCEYSPRGNTIGEFGGNVGKPGQGKGGEPGIGDFAGQDDEKKDDESGSDQRSVGARLLAALVAASVLAGVFV